MTIEIKNFYMQVIVKKIKDKPQTKRRYFLITYLAKYLYLEYKKNSQISKIRNQETKLKIRAKDLKRYSIREGIQLADENMQRCSISVVTGQYKLKNIMKYNYLLDGKTKKSKSNKNNKPPDETKLW